MRANVLTPQAFDYKNVSIKNFNNENRKKENKLLPLRFLFIAISNRKIGESDYDWLQVTTNQDTSD